MAVLDWQITYRGPAVSDVAYFLCQSMAVEERRAHEQRRSSAAGTTAGRAAGRGVHGDARPTTRSTLAWEQYRRAVLATTVYAVTAAGAMDPANERGRELVTAMAVRSFAAVLELGSDEFLP